jgi:hypothetical protein
MLSVGILMAGVSTKRSYERRNILLYFVAKTLQHQHQHQHQLQLQLQHQLQHQHQHQLPLSVGHVPKPDSQRSRVELKFLFQLQTFSINVTDPIDFCGMLVWDG